MWSGINWHILITWPTHCELSILSVSLKKRSIRESTWWSGQSCPQLAFLINFQVSHIRSLNPFTVETWSMKDMALFNACICQFGKHFEKFVPIVSVNLLSIDNSQDLIEHPSIKHILSNSTLFSNLTRVEKFWPIWSNSTHYGVLWF